MTQTTFEQGQSQVAELVKRFSRNAATYRSPEYNETWARGKSRPRSVLKKRSERPALFDISPRVTYNFRDLSGIAQFVVS